MFYKNAGVFNRRKGNAKKKKGYSSSSLKPSI